MSQPAPRAPKVRDPRDGLRTSATLATVFTILGHTFFGFEQSVGQVLVALATGYTAALSFEWVDATSNGRRPGFLGRGVKGLVDFLLSAHMTSITLAFLLYVGSRLWVLSLAVVIAIGSKYLLRVSVDGRLRHFMNPSNIAIAIVLYAFQWTGVIPWAYTVEVHGIIDVAIPIIVIGLGTRLNLLFTGRAPTILAWLGTFVALAALRALAQGAPILPELMPLTGIPLVLFTFYMITDPQTSPSSLRGQILFGGGIAVAYSVLLLARVQYTMFYAVTVVAGLRGLWLIAASRGLVPSGAPSAVAPVGANPVASAQSRA